MATECNRTKHALTIRWRIENIRFWESCSDEREIRSLDFTPPILEGKWFRLVFFWRIKEYVEKHPCLSLICHSEAFDFPIDFEVSLLGLDETQLVRSVALNQEIMQNAHNVVISSVTNKELFETKRSLFLPQDTLTLRCRIWKSYGDFSKIDYISTRTRIEYLENSFLWPISGFRTLQINREVTTPVKFTFSNGSNDFLLKFSLKGESLEFAVVCIELLSVSIPNIAAVVSLKVFALKTGPKVIETSGKKSVFGSQSQEIKISIILSTRDELLKQKFYIKNDVLSLICEVFAVQCTNIIEKKYFGFPYDIPYTPYLPKCISEYSHATTNSPRYPNPINITLTGNEPTIEDIILYREQNTSDFELRSGEISFPVHKEVLRFRSGFFDDMFSNGIREHESTSMEIQNFDAHTLNQMLTFIYMDCVKGLLWENILNLYSAANQYLVLPLIRECRSFFRWKINPYNFCDVLFLAVMNDDDELKSFIMDYSELRFLEIMNSPQWYMFMEREPEIAVKSLHQMYLKHSYKPVIHFSKRKPNKRSKARR